MIISALLLSVTVIAGAQNITIAKQGHFSVGGRAIQREGEYDNRNSSAGQSRRRRDKATVPIMRSWTFRYPQTLIDCHWYMYTVTAVRASAGR